MNKKILGKDVFYTLAWSPLHKYDKYTAMRILPELSGILNLQYKKENKYVNVLFYACWRDGCRVGLKKLLDPLFSTTRGLSARIDIQDMYYRYTAIETSPADMQDILFWLVSTYKTQLNTSTGFLDSQRYMNISIKETTLSGDDVIERLPGNR